MKKCEKCGLEMDDLSKFEVCYTCRHDSVGEKTDDVINVSDKKIDPNPVKKTENVGLPKNQSFDEQVLYHVNKQTKLLTEQYKLQKRISNNILFFFWITIIGFVFSFLLGLFI